MKSLSSGLLLALITILILPKEGIAQSFDIDNKSAHYDIKIFDDLVNPKGKVTSNATINSLFNKHLNSLLSSSGNIATNKGQVFYSPENDKIFLGRTVSNVQNFNQKLTWLGQVAVSAPVKKNYATIRDNDNLFAQGLGISLKGTFVGRGILKMGDPLNGKGSDSKLTKELKAKRKVIAAELQNELRRDVEHAYQVKLSDRKELEKYLSKKIPELQKARRKEFVKQELNALEGQKEKGYNSLTTWWMSGEIDLGITKIDQLYVASLMSTNIDTAGYFPLRAELNIGGMYSNRWINEAYGRIGLGLEDFTIVQAKGLSASTIASFANQIINLDSLSQATIKDNEVYAEDLTQLRSYYLNLEVALFPSILRYWGIRVAFQPRWFKYQDKNESVHDWTLAVPFVFDDKDGEPNVKFELQWRNIRGNKTLGFSAGIPIGGSIFK